MSHKLRDSVIRTQQELNQAMKSEDNIVYIAISGHVATFNGRYALTTFQANERILEISESQKAMIEDLKKTKNFKELDETLEVCLQTFIVPYRLH
jgi:hypothetical protein